MFSFFYGNELKSPIFFLSTKVMPVFFVPFRIEENS